MIVTIHGAFDERGDDNGISTLSARLDELGLTAAPLIELNVHEWVDVTLEQLLAEPFVGVGYSNGMDQLMAIVGHAIAKIAPVDLLRVSINIICIDGVHWGGGFLAPPWHMFPGIRTCWNYMRTEQVGIPPWHQKIDKDEPPDFQTIFIDANHGDIPADGGLQTSVCNRATELFAAGLPAGNQTV